MKGKRAGADVRPARRDREKRESSSGPRGFLKVKSLDNVRTGGAVSGTGRSMTPVRRYKEAYPLCKFTDILYL